MGVNWEGEDSVSNFDSNNSLDLDDNAMTLESEDVGNNDPNLTTKKHNLCEFFGKRQEEVKTGSQEEQATDDLP